jgi:hypothetical protein
VTRFRKICRWLHRELSFIAVGLTLAYAISGVAVNHIDSWNPNYQLATETFTIAPVEPGSNEEVVPAVLDQLALDEPVKSTWRSAPTRLRVILEGATYDVDLLTGRVERRGFSPRPFFYEVNYLHLNHGKGLWTWIADAFAVVLALLALSGIFLVSGRRGLAGRGGVMLVIGVALPIAYLIFARWLQY